MVLLRSTPKTIGAHKTSKRPKPPPLPNPASHSPQRPTPCRSVLTRSCSGSGGRCVRPRGHRNRRSGSEDSDGTAVELAGSCEPCRFGSPFSRCCAILCFVLCLGVFTCCRALSSPSDNSAGSSLRTRPAAPSERGTSPVTQHRCICAAPQERKTIQARIN